MGPDLSSNPLSLICYLFHFTALGQWKKPSGDCVRLLRIQTGTDVIKKHHTQSTRDHEFCIFRLLLSGSLLLSGDKGEGIS